MNNGVINSSNLISRSINRCLQKLFSLYIRAVQLGDGYGSIFLAKSNSYANSKYGKAKEDISTVIDLNSIRKSIVK